MNYAHDANRRRMFLVVQRILIWLAIVLVIAFAFAPELSSLATFLGLLTAGVAVALQNVILAVVGYFLLVGKLGIRVGDRVRISGVTGDVIDVGLLQFQLREVDQDNEQLTGNVATFSHSFVFVSPATVSSSLVPPMETPISGKWSSECRGLADAALSIRCSLVSALSFASASSRISCLNMSAHWGKCVREVEGRCLQHSGTWRVVLKGPLFSRSA